MMKRTQQNGEWNQLNTEKRKLCKAKMTAQCALYMGALKL